MAALSPLRFTGVSSFSTDFEAILTRASDIASLPIKELQNQQAQLLGRKQSLTTINSTLSSLTDAVTKLGETGRTRALSVTSSNTTRVSVVNNGAAVSTAYSITDITSVAKAASETTAAGFATPDATPVAGNNALELVVGSNTFQLDLSASGNHLNGLRDAINAAGAGVTATILNSGSNYYLSLTAQSPGATALEVRTTPGDGASNILTSTNQGANAVFKLNGVPMERSDNIIADAVPGLTFTILDKTTAGETVTLSAVPSRGTLATALSDFVSAYNSTVQNVNAQIGERAGVLSGDHLVGQVSRTLRQVTGYQGGGAIKSLAELGIELDRQGNMSFNTTHFYSLSTAQLEGAFQFLGSENSGFGGLSSSLNQLSDPVSGLIKLQQNNYDSSDLRIQKQMAELTARIERSQASLSLKLQQADSLLAMLASQQSALDASLKSVTFAAYGKQA